MVTPSRIRVLRAYSEYRRRPERFPPAVAMAFVQLDADQIIAKPYSGDLTEAHWDSFYASRYSKIIRLNRDYLPYWNEGVTASSEE